MTEPKTLVDDKKLASALVVSDASAPLVPTENDVVETSLHDDDDETPKVNPFAQFMGCAP